LLTEKGTAVCQKIDIFKELMWFSYENQSSQWHILSVDKVKEIIASNKQNKKVLAIEEFVVEQVKVVAENYQNVVGQDSLTRFDKPKVSNNKNKNRNKNKNKKKPTISKNVPKKD